MISQGEDQIEIFRVSVFPGESSGKGADGDSVLVRLIIKMATLDKQSTSPHLTHEERETRKLQQTPTRLFTGPDWIYPVIILEVEEFLKISYVIDDRILLFSKKVLRNNNLASINNFKLEYYTESSFLILSLL